MILIAAAIAAIFFGMALRAAGGKQNNPNKVDGLFWPDGYPEDQK